MNTAQKLAVRTDVRRIIAMRSYTIPSSRTGLKVSGMFAVSSFSSSSS